MKKKRLAWWSTDFWAMALGIMLLAYLASFVVVLLLFDWGMIPQSWDDTLIGIYPPINMASNRPP